MARCFQSAQEFILGAFPVMVGALVSDDAEAICQKNDLTFVELVRPFCQLSSEAHIRDPVNPSIVVPVKNWKMRIIDIQAPLPPPVLVKRVLTDVVSKSLLSVDLKSKAAADKQIDIPTPWYDAYKDCFFQLIEPMEHEFIRHYLACILVVSTKHPDPMNAFAALSSRQTSIQQAAAQSSSPQFRWFSSNTFKYYLLLHDVSDGEDAKADAVYQSMKSVYGSHTCFLLQLNSRSKMFHQTAEQKLNFSDLWTQHMYPFTDETFDIDESELEKVPKVSNAHEASQRDVDKSEEAIVSVLESIDKSIQETQSGPRAMSFNDPLTSMQYKESLADDDSDIIEDSLGVYKYGDARDRKPSPRPRKLSERSQRLHEYKKSLRQFSYNMVGGAVQNNRKERGFCLTLMDQDKIRACLYEFAIRGLLPHIEKLMRMISEQILARRGLHKSIFNATKKWFGGSKSAGGSIGTGFNAGNSYTMDSPELHHRRLGDLAFLVQHFDLAYNSYHSAKREFNNDHAWVYFAGALEMAAISAFMLGNNRVYPVHYFEACISTYMNTCRLPEYATRACLMSTEALKSRDMYPESASEFIKLTHEDADLRSALFLEQAAHCYLHNKPPMFRKYAFHMILAGHRFSKSLQRKHTLRCYINALQVYQNKSWYLAEDHVNFTIGRQSFNLGNLEDAQLALKSLLVYESQQPAAQQASHMREFLAVFKQYLASKTSQSDADFLPNLPLPHIDCSATKVLLSVSPDALDNNVTPTPATPASRRTRTVCAGSYTFQKAYSKSYMLRWAELEKQVLLAVKGELPYPFKAFVPCLSTSTDNSRSATLSVGETFAVELNFFNPLMITLNLLELTLLWEFSPAAQDGIDDAAVTNRVHQHDGYVIADVIANLPVKASEKKSAAFKIAVQKSGTLKITGVKYVLSSVSVTSSSEEGNLELSVHQEAALRAVGVLGMQEIFIRGPRLNSTKQERATALYGIDKRLEPLIIPALPELKVTMLDLPMTMLCGEIQQVMFTFQNVGRLSLKNLHVVTNFPECFSLADAGEALSCSKNNRSARADPCGPVNSSTPFARKRVPREIVDYSRCSESISKVRISLDNGVLPPGAEVNVPFFIYGLDNSGVHEIYFLFYYEPVEEVKNVPYRIVQRMVRVQTLSTLNLMAASRPSERHDGAYLEHEASCRQQQTREDSGSTADGSPDKQDPGSYSSSLASRSLENRVLSLVVENKSKMP